VARAKEADSGGGSPFVEDRRLQGGSDGKGGSGGDGKLKRAMEGHSQPNPPSQT
jgi:hypothetical protein